MKCKRMGLACGAAVLGLAANAWAQPLPAPGFSEPALVYAPPSAGSLVDEFADPGPSTELWWVAVSPEQAASGASIEVVDNACVMTSATTPVGVEGSPIGLISRVGPFAPQSFTLAAEGMWLGPRQGEYGIYLAVSDLLVPGGPPSRVMGVMLYHGEHQAPDGQIVTDEYIVVADGSGGLGASYTHPMPGLFEQLAGAGFSMHVAYDAENGLMTATVEPVGFSQTVPAVFDQEREVALLMGGGGGPSGPLEESYLVMGVDRVETSFSYTTPGTYHANLTPFQEDGTIYDGSALLGAPATLFLDPANAPEPVLITADHTPVPADGITSYAVALLTVDQGDAIGPLTALTSLSPAELAAIPGVTVHDYVPGLYMAMGPGEDYWIDYQALAGPVLEELEALIVPGVGPGQSLVAKLAALRAAYDAGEYDLAWSRLDALRDEVESQRGKHIEEALADTILHWLGELEGLILRL